MLCLVAFLFLLLLFFLLLYLLSSWLLLFLLLLNYFIIRRLLLVSSLFFLLYFKSQVITIYMVFILLARRLPLWWISYVFQKWVMRSWTVHSISISIKIELIGDQAWFWHAEGRTNARSGGSSSHTNHANRVRCRYREKEQPSVFINFSSQQ